MLKITPDVDYNECLKRLDFKLIEQMNQTSVKVPKVV